MNGPVIVWSTIPAFFIPLALPCCLLLETGLFKLDKIHLLAHPSGPLSDTWDFSVRFTLENFILIYFLIQFWRLKIFDFVRRGSIGDFLTDPNSQSLLDLLNNSFFFWKIWAQVKRSCLAINRFSLRSSWRRKLIWVLNLVIFSIAFFIIP